MEELRLATRQKDGATLRQHLESVWRQTAQMPRELDVPDCPPEARYIWGWFCELSAEREQGMDGPRAITSTGMKNWAELRRITLTEFELQAIARLDRIFLDPPPPDPPSGEYDDD